MNNSGLKKLSSDQFEKLLFSNNFDVVAFCNQLFRAPVLRALFVSDKQGQVLISDNQKRDFLEIPAFTEMPAPAAVVAASVLERVSCPVKQAT